MRVAKDVIAKQREMAFELRGGVQVGCRVIEISTTERPERRVFPRPQLVERARRFIRRIRAFEGGGRVGGFHQSHRNRKDGNSPKALPRLRVLRDFVFSSFDPSTGSGSWP